MPGFIKVYLCIGSWGICTERRKERGYVVAENYRRGDDEKKLMYWVERHGAGRTSDGLNVVQLTAWS